MRGKKWPNSAELANKSPLTVPLPVMKNAQARGDAEATFCGDDGVARKADGTAGD